MSSITVCLVSESSTTASDLVAQLGELEIGIINSSLNNIESDKEFNNRTPDLFILESTGNKFIDTAQSMTAIRKVFQKPIIIFTRNTSKEKLDEMLNLRPDGYLVEPYHVLNLKATIQVAIQHYSAHHTNKALRKSQDDDDYILVDSKLHGRLRIQLKDVVYLKYDRGHTYISCTRQVYKTRCTLEMIEKDLDENFYQVHRKHIVNSNYVRAIKNKEILLTKKFVPTGAEYDLTALKKAFSTVDQS
ncbi:MAG: LytTR family transcriptional regulator DNA-binding domain-containing protein [Nonlabens sp.]